MPNDNSEICICHESCILVNLYLFLSRHFTFIYLVNITENHSTLTNKCYSYFMCFSNGMYAYTNGIQNMHLNKVNNQQLSNIQQRRDITHERYFDVFCKSANIVCSIFPVQSLSPTIFWFRSILMFYFHFL